MSPDSVSGLGRNEGALTNMSMEMDFTKLSDAEIENVITAASNERSARRANGPHELPPKECRVEIGPSFLPTVANGAFTLRVYSKFFGWPAFNWHREGVEKLNGATQKALDSGQVARRSTFTS